MTRALEALRDLQREADETDEEVAPGGDAQAELGTPPGHAVRAALRETWTTARRPISMPTASPSRLTGRAEVVEASYRYATLSRPFAIRRARRRSWRRCFTSPYHDRGRAVSVLPEGSSRSSPSFRPDQRGAAGCCPANQPPCGRRSAKGELLVATVSLAIAGLGGLVALLGVVAFKAALVILLLVALALLAQTVLLLTARAALTRARTRLLRARLVYYPPPARLHLHVAGSQGGTRPTPGDGGRGCGARRRGISGRSSTLEVSGPERRDRGGTRRLPSMRHL